MTSTQGRSGPDRGDETNRRRHGALRPQRLAAPVTLYVEPFSAHPLESQRAELYAAPDGYLDPSGAFSTERGSDEDVPVHRITLEPGDGLYPLPYVARQADGSPWESEAVDPAFPDAGHRQTFYPDAARLFEEIDRFHLGADGRVAVLGSQADFEFFRPAPSGGYTRGVGDDGLDPEVLGIDYFPYRPPEDRREPLIATLATLTNIVQDTLHAGFDGAIWLEGSPFVEETCYWLNLLLDTTVPLVCTAGSIETGRVNVIDAVTYLTSGVWRDAEGRNRLGAVCVVDEQILAAREVQKADDRPGGFRVTGDHGGVLGTIGKPGPPVVTFLPNRRHTWRSDVRVSMLPSRVRGLCLRDGHVRERTVTTLNGDDGLRTDSMPAVRIIKHARYLQRAMDTDDTVDVELFGRLHRDLAVTGLVGVVLEAGTPYGDGTEPLERGLRRAIHCGVPVVKVGRGDPGGFVPTERVPLGIAGANLTATKARILLMACLLRYGALPPAADPEAPTPAEVRGIREHLAKYQAVFDTH